MIKLTTAFYCLIAVAGAWAFAMYMHPYEQCKRKYTAPEDIMECVWIKGNP